MEAIAVDVCL